MSCVFNFCSSGSCFDLTPVPWSVSPKAGQRAGVGRDMVLTGKDSCGFLLKEGKLCSSFAYQESSAGETLLILIIAQINGKIIRKLHNNGSCCACVSCLLISHDCCIPVLGWRSGVRPRGSSVPVAEQELSWLWGRLRCRERCD